MGICYWTKRFREVYTCKIIEWFVLPEAGTITVNDTMILSEETVWDVRKQIDGISKSR